MKVLQNGNVFLEFGFIKYKLINFSIHVSHVKWWQGLIIIFTFFTKQILHRYSFSSFLSLLFSLICSRNKRLMSSVQGSSSELSTSITKSCITADSLITLSLCPFTGFMFQLNRIWKPPTTMMLIVWNNLTRTWNNFF